MTSIAVQRFLDPEQNVGGGDRVTRLVATGLLVALCGLVLPQSHIPYRLLKISLLIAAEMGLVGLMLGMFLRSKTYFAGAQLFATPLLMLWLAGHQLTYVAAVTGLVLAAVGIGELATRRSRLNALLGLSSFRAPRAEPSLLEAALLPEVPDPGATREPAEGAAARDGVR